MTDKLTQNLTEATVVNKTGDRVPIYSAASPSELRYITPDNLVPDSSDTVKGKVELATTAETTTGTDATRAVTPDGLHDMTSLAGAAWMLDEDSMTSNSDTKVPSQQSVKAYGDRTVNTTLNIHPLFAPRGFLINGKIVITDTGSGLLVAIKTLAGNDPSSIDPAYIRIGDSMRTLSAQGTNYIKDLTLADGTNLFNSGSAELATKEVDYFVYACYNTSLSVTQLLVSRIPGAAVYSDFSTTATNEKYAAYYSGVQPLAGDAVEVIGRFAATLSAGAGYTWSVPTFTAANLIQRPIYETRVLQQVLGLGNVTEGNAVGVQEYKITGNICKVNGSFQFGSTTSASGAIQLTVPFSSKWASTPKRPTGSFYAIDTGTRHYAGTCLFLSATTYLEAIVESGGAQQIANNYPITWATGDIFSWDIAYEI